VSKYIWERVSATNKKAIKKWEDKVPGLKPRLVRVLNKIISERSLPKRRAFLGVKPSRERKEMLEKSSEAVDFKALNRLLISDAYPKEIRWSQAHRLECCEYLSQKLFSIIGKMVDPGDVMRKELLKMAESWEHAINGITWVAPSGFPVCQRALKVTRNRIRAGKFRLVTYVPEVPEKIDMKAQGRKILPNFIHSLDAAHLMLTIQRLLSEELRDFGVIHDGYAVHACDIDQLQRALREAFVEMYRKPILEDLRDHQRRAGRTFDDPLPAPLDFDISEVLKSDYFFC